MNIGIGLIGLGGITQKVHIPDLLNAGHLTIVAICDIDPEALESTRSKLGLPADCCFEAVSYTHLDVYKRQTV